MNKVVFLDRDGTLIVDKEYLSDPEGVELLPDVVPALKRLIVAGFDLIVVTNQSGVGRGYYEAQHVEAVNERLVGMLAEKGIPIRAVYYCPHHPDDDCGCRKPAAGLLQRAAAEHDVDLEASAIVGDKETDVAAGRAAACGRCIRLAQEDDATADFTAPTLQAAVEWLLREELDDAAMLTERSILPFAIVVSLLAVAVTVAGLYAYAAYGGPWVDGLDERIGEVVARRAHMAAEANRPDDAAALYERALQLNFEDPRQRPWTLHAYADLLIEQGEYDRAAVVAQQAMEIDPESGVPYVQIVQARMKAENYPQALAALEDLYTYRLNQNNTRGQAAAVYQMAVAYRAMGETDDALGNFMASFNLAPSVKAALAAADLLIETGRPLEAAPYLDYVLAYAKGHQVRRAQALAEKLPAAADGEK